MKPNVFVSSTCFDLSQVRRDIEETIEKIGFNPILSDRNTFPINPNEELIENCINNISKNADILLLIIGNRYGSKFESGKSITNIEYDTARNIGIPIFVFIKAEILNYLDVWKSNKDGDFSNQVDSIDIFKFVSKIREDDKVWSFDFSSAQDISSTFISQMAFRFKELLDINRQLNHSETSLIWERISAKARKILLYQNNLYEIDFFIQVLSDELNKLTELRLNYDYNVLSSCSLRIEDNLELHRWFKTQMKSLTNYINTFDVLINKLFRKYYGEPGVPSDIKSLLLIAQSYRKLLEEMLRWSLNVKNISVAKESEELLSTFSQYLDKPINTCLEFPDILKAKIQNGRERLSKGEKNIHLEIILTIDIDEKVSQRFNYLLNRL